MSGRRLNLEAKNRCCDNILFSISIPADSRAPIVQELLKKCLDTFPHSDIELTVSAGSSAGVAGESFMEYDARREFRRNFAQRTQAGIAAAKARGVQFGRRPKKLPHNFDKVAAQWKAKELSSRKAAQMLGVSPPTFLKWMRE